MKNFYDKIQQIESLLGNSKKFKNKNLLATAIYFKIRTDTSLRRIPLQDVPFTWFNLRYWMQKLERKGTLNQIKLIVGGSLSEVIEL